MPICFNRHGKLVYRLVITRSMAYVVRLSMEEPTDYHGGAQTYYVNPTEDCSIYEGDNYVRCLENLVEHLQESC